MTDDFQNSFIVRVLRNPDEILAEILRRKGADDMADWARRDDGSWLTWDDLDAQEHGPKLMELVLDWHARHEAAELLLGEGGRAHLDGMDGVDGASGIFSCATEPASRVFPVETVPAATSERRAARRTEPSRSRKCLTPSRAGNTLRTADWTSMPPREEPRESPSRD